MSLVANVSVVAAETAAPPLPEWIDGDELLWLLAATPGITFSLRDLNTRVVVEALEEEDDDDIDEDAFAAGATEIFDRRTPSPPLVPAGLALLLPL